MYQKILLKEKLIKIFIFALCGASKGFMKTFKAFIKPFETQRRVKIKSYFSLIILDRDGKD